MLFRSYNAPWKQENLESLEIAETAYRTALAYWNTAKEWATKAQNIRWIYLPEVQFWDDESHRIVTGELNYERIINRELTRLQKVRTAFLAMDNSTY